jgi:hypothetical protein
VSTVHAVVLVEGDSDRIALKTLAGRQGRDLAAEGIEVVAMGGITNTRVGFSSTGVSPSVPRHSIASTNHDDFLLLAGSAEPAKRPHNPGYATLESSAFSHKAYCFAPHR